MHIADPIVEAWKAELALGFERRGASTVLVRREHRGPLRVQKALHPEGPEVCHVIVLHPPSGIAGGDELQLEVALATGSHALLTTPGAGKWYRSSGPWATQTLRFDVQPDSVLEWLPQETIVFNAAMADMRTDINLQSGACFMGQEILCFGRRAMREDFDTGHIHLGTDIRLDNKLIWHERGRIEGGSRGMASATGLDGNTVSGSFLAAGRPISPELIATCRQHVAEEDGAKFAITALPNLFVARYLGHSSEAAKAWFAALWKVLRPELVGRAAEIPRIWRT